MDFSTILKAPIFQRRGYIGNYYANRARADRIHTFPFDRSACVWGRYLNQYLSTFLNCNGSSLEYCCLSKTFVLFTSISITVLSLCCPELTLFHLFLELNQKKRKLGGNLCIKECHPNPK